MSVNHQNEQFPVRFFLSLKFNIVYQTTYVLRVLKKVSKRCFCNKINTFNIIIIICYLFKTLIVNALQRGQKFTSLFSILNRQIVKKWRWETWQF